MTEEIIKELEKEEPSEKLQDLLSRLNTWAKHSRSTMSERYTQWDRNNDVYRGVRPPDSQDIEAQEMDEPEQFVVPMTYSMVHTAAAFCYQLFKQNEHLFEYHPTGPEDYGYAHVCEQTLERDLRRNEFDPKLYQHLLDILRFSIGVFKGYWETDKKLIPVNRNQDIEGGGFNFGSVGATEMVEVTHYEGNKVVCIDPYKWYPDTRLPLTRWKEGEFCADEMEYTVAELKDMEYSNKIVGLDYVEGLDMKTLDSRKGTRLPALMKDAEKHGTTENVACITEFQAKLIPNRWGLGEEDRQMMFLIWVANDNRIVRIERQEYLHCEFTYDMAQYSPDMQQKINEALSDITFPMQDITTYLMNSRVLSVRRSLDSHLIVDPEIVDVSGFENRSPVIMTRKGAPKSGLRDAVMQLPIVDTTANHMQDADMMMKMMQMVTGVNENALGQFHGGRRSASEARAVNAGAASRLKLVAQLIWQQSLTSLGRKMLLNQRQGMTLKTFTAIVGHEEPQLPDWWAKFHPDDPEMLVANEDFFVFDSTLQSEKGFVAQSLQEILVAMIANPQLAIQMDIDIKGLLDEIQALRGTGSLSRFSLRRRLLEEQQRNGSIPDLRPIGVDGGAQGAEGIPGESGIPNIQGGV